MGRDQPGAGIGGEDDLEQIARVQTEDGAAVGADVADPFEPLLEDGRCGEGGEKDHVMDLAHLPLFFIDAADLAGEDEEGLALAG